MMSKFFKMLLPLLLISISTVSGKSPFKWEKSSTPAGTVFTLNIQPGNFVYQESIRFDLRSASGKPVVPQPLAAPVAKTDSDPVQLIYPEGSWQWRTTENVVSGKVEHQGCNQEGVCFMPEETIFDTASTAAMTAGVNGDDAAKFSVLRKQEGYMNKAEFMEFLKDGKVSGFSGDLGIWGILLLTLLGGIGLNFTPCILPMVPVTLIIIGAKGGGKQGMLRGTAYGTGMAVAYGLLGIAAALLGVSFGTLNSMPWFNFVIAGIFLVMALCMSGVLNFNFGASFRVSPQKLKGPMLLVTFTMGVLAALLAGACVAPVVISVLLFVVREYNSGNSWALLLPFILGIGMALPWPFAGYGLSVMPKPGKFMLVVKYLLAAVVAVMGIYYLWLGIRLARGNSSSYDGKTDGFSALYAAAETARNEKKPILVKFGASWCKNCHAMEKETLKDPEVAQYIQDNFVMADFPAEDPNAPRIKALLSAWNIPGFPAFVIIEPK